MMEKIIILVCLSLLFSCTNDANTNATSSEDSCIKYTETDRVLSARSIQVSVESHEPRLPLEGVAVQIDHNGICRRTDANGLVRFYDLNSGRHDIHVFGKPGYEWSSDYQVDFSTLSKKIYSLSKLDSQPVVDSKIHSYLNIDGTIINSDVDSKISVSPAFTIPKSLRVGDRFNTTNTTNTSYSLSYEFDSSEATPIDSEFWITEQVKNASGDYVLADAVLVPKFTTVTTSKTGSASIKDVTFLAPQAKLPRSEVLSFGNVSYPVGFSFSGVNIQGSFLSSTFPNRYHTIPLFSLNSSPNTPKTLSPSTIVDSYTTPFNFKNLSISLGANSKGAISVTVWRYFSTKYKNGATNVTITPKMTNVPIFIPNQKGDTIAWSASPVAPEPLFLSIGDSGDTTRASWRIRLSGNMSEIRLPQLPDSVKPMLIPNTSYSLLLSGIYVYPNGNGPDNIEIEDFLTVNRWTR